MRRLVLALAALGFVSTQGALAADLPVKAPPIAPAPVMTWTGFYAGLNLGYGWANANSNNNFGNGDFSNDLSGVVGGGQLGYNWQTGPLVLGIEGDFQGTGQSRSRDLLGGAITVEHRLPWFATLRGRLGYAAGPWLLYATGGAAWVDYKFSVTALGTTLSNESTRSAWTAGGGVEWMFAPRWSAKIEYLYIDAGSISGTTPLGNTIDVRARENVARAGVNYHF